MFTQNFALIEELPHSLLYISKVFKAQVHLGPIQVFQQSGEATSQLACNVYVSVMSLSAGPDQAYPTDIRWIR